MTCNFGGNCRKLCFNNNCNVCLNISFANHEKSKYWSTKNNLNPRNVFLKSNNKYIFNCDKCHHEFEAILSNIVSGQWCSYCKGNHKLCENQNCKICFEKSFASNENAKFWSNKNKVNARDVHKSSRKKYLFNCNICFHDFEASLDSISRNNSWCSYCENKKLCSNNSCDYCYKKSFAIHEKSKYWSDKNNEKPRNVFLNSNNKYIFNCDKCNHDFYISLGHINLENNWCSYCYGNFSLCNNDCDMCYNKSFASSDKSKYFMDKNNINPRNLFINSNKKYWFKCKNNHEFESALHNVNKGYWCPYCLYKNEEECRLIFETFFDKKFIKTRKIIAPFELDGYNDELKIAFEYHGEQHYYYIPYFHKNEQKLQDIIERDKLKETLCKNNKINLITIKYDIKNKTEYIKNRLKELENDLIQS